MSYGSRKLLQAASAWLLGRDLLILDETDSGLSYRAASLGLVETLRESGAGLVLVTHDAALARAVARTGARDGRGQGRGRRPPRQRTPRSTRRSPRGGSIPGRHAVTADFHLPGTSFLHRHRPPGAPARPASASPRASWCPRNRCALAGLAAPVSPSPPSRSAAARLAALLRALASRPPLHRPAHAAVRARGRGAPHGRGIPAADDGRRARRRSSTSGAPLGHRGRVLRPAAERCGSRSWCSRSGGSGPAVPGRARRHRHVPLHPVPRRHLARREGRPPPARNGRRAGPRPGRGHGEGRQDHPDARDGARIAGARPQGAADLAHRPPVRPRFALHAVAVAAACAAVLLAPPPARGAANLCTPGALIYTGGVNNETQPNPPARSTAPCGSRPWRCSPP